MVALGTTHWTARRKAAIVIAVRSFPNERQAMLAEHAISEEKFTTWERDYDAAGPPALRSTRLVPNRPDSEIAAEFRERLRVAF